MNGSLVKAGCLTQEHPKRFYNFALLDPLDKPFASFRYFPRTWGGPALPPVRTTNILTLPRPIDRPWGSFAHSERTILATESPSQKSHPKEQQHHCLLSLQ